MLDTANVFCTEGSPVRTQARRAEELGFDAVWAGDHVIGRTPILDCLTALAVAAGATDRVQLGTAVLLPALRHPVLLAKSTASLDVLSNGRLVLGMGAGGDLAAEFAALGVPTEERGRRLDDVLDVLPQLWSGKPVAFQGRVLQVQCPPLAPLPVSRPHPPLWVGGRSAAAITRAARAAEGWVAMWMSPTAVRRAVQDLRSAADQHDRPPPTVALVLFVNVGSDPAVCRSEAEAFFARAYDADLERFERWTVLGAPALLPEVIAQYRDAGVDRFILAPAGPHWQAQYDHWAAALM